jgi:hypothetical protein
MATMGERPLRNVLGAMLSEFGIDSSQVLEDGCDYSGYKTLSPREEQSVVYWLTDGERSIFKYAWPKGFPVVEFMEVYETWKRLRF